MKRMVAFALAVAVALSGCDKESDRNQAASSPGLPPTATGAPSQTSPKPPPTHNYQMVDNGTYGYEAALSEEDVRKGIATKPLMMMRYEGKKNGTFTILILGTDANDNEVVNRVSCQAPCQFAKSEVLLGDTVTKTETLRVTTDSIVGGMLQDAVSGQLVAYGQKSDGGSITMPSQSTQAPVYAPQQPAQSVQATGPTGSSDMWIGPNDMNVRSCPGTTCSALAVVPKHSKVSADSASVRNVTEASGSQTPWVRITYTGPTCDVATIDRQLGCVDPRDSGSPITGWVNFTRLVATQPSP